MPEYLAPAVYVEEIDTGSKPIEGVSTSTAGAVGVTERGPVGVPILVTSWGDYRRWFGDFLAEDLYGEHRFLPHAVEGFFTNGGRRLYVTRVLARDAASQAATGLFRHQSDDAGAVLLTRAAASASSVLLVGTGAPFPVALNDWVRVGAGSDAEYRQATGAPAGATTALVSRIPFQRTHAVAAANVEHAPFPGGPPPVTGKLVGAHPAGSGWVTVSGATGAYLVDRVLQVAAPGPPLANEELHYIRTAIDLGSSNWRLELETPLQFDHPNNEDASMLAALVVAPTTGLNRVAVPGDSTLIVVTNAGFTTAGDLVRLVVGTRGEVRRIGAIHAVRLGAPLGRAAAAGALIEHVTRADTGTLRTLDEPVPAGAMAVAVDDRQGFQPGQVIRVGAPGDPDVEYAVIRELPGQLPPGPVDPGRVVLGAPLRRPHGGVSLASRQIVMRQTISNQPQAGTLVHPVASGQVDVLVSAALLPGAPGPTDLVRLTASGEEQYVRVGAHVARPVQQLTFITPLLLPHAAPQPLVVRQPLLEVVALDPGVWGNRLRVAARREPTPLVRSRIRSDASGIQDPTHIRLDSAAGAEPGTVLSLADVAGGPIDTPFKIVAIDRQNGYLLTLDTALPAAAALGSAIVSLEVALGVYLLRQPDPAQPSRNAQLLDSEVFRDLSLDPRHSRYIHRVIGTTWTPGAPGDVDDDGRPLRRADRRSEGESAYLRVRDVAQDLPEPARTTALQSIRLGPEFLVDVLPDGRREAARRVLAGGDDQTAALTDADYVGLDDPDPERRTGLNALGNIDEISIVTAPGRMGAAMQDALIAHCERLRYRFAILDAFGPPADSLADVQAQRQQFDTKYAALYHPWLLIPHPFPLTPGPAPDYPVPSAGHVLGIYARTDIERGVHKAPANEVVRGIVGLQRLLTKGEHDILNAYPVNVNVIRDFRPDNRGIRVFGARVITSDSDWKYVNVRRLLIFIEASIDRGLQWVVFEPNAEPLWARVRRSITNFLTLVWRNGALEGTKIEEAFFVRCDRTTMTQTDIDSGRLICVVGVAPVKPAEFVIVRIGLWTAHAEE
jgi:phage tail sheath protein FI